MDSDGLATEMFRERLLETRRDILLLQIDILRLYPQTKAEEKRMGVVSKLIDKASKILFRETGGEE